MSHCREGNVSLGSLCERHLIKPSSVIFLCVFSLVLFLSLCVHLSSQEVGLLAGRVAQLSSLCLGQPQGQSGLSGRFSAGATSEPSCRRKTKEMEALRTARAVDTRHNRTMNQSNPSSQGVLEEGWRHINPAMQSEWLNICSNDIKYSCDLLAAFAGEMKLERELSLC